MLSHKDNELMCRVGPGTPQGTALRRFWLPVMVSTELPKPDCDPMRLTVMGENLVAFRDTNGVIGILDEYCRHRGASLALGRVEECGIRCIYHGWKFAVDGSVLETPNVADPSFKKRVKTKSYPVREAGGMVWTYMGPPEHEPPFPDFPFHTVPETNRVVVMSVVRCNFVQVLEGLVDSSHLSVLHTTGLQATNNSSLPFATSMNHMQFDAAPTIEVATTDFGFRYAALRKIHTAEGEKTMARVAAFQAPCFVNLANGDIWFCCVPVDDETTMFFHLLWDEEKRYGEDPLRTEQLTFVGLDDKTLRAAGLTRDTYDAPDKPGPLNGFRQDREAMRNGHFSGFLSFEQEDAMVGLSSGRIRDRTKEVLCRTDLAIHQLYKILLASARSTLEGTDPAGLTTDPRQVRGVFGELEKGESWQTLLGPSGAEELEPAE